MASAAERSAKFDTGWNREPSHTVLALGKINSASAFAADRVESRLDGPRVVSAAVASGIEGLDLDVCEVRDICGDTKSNELITQALYTGDVVRIEKVKARAR